MVIAVSYLGAVKQVELDVATDGFGLEPIERPFRPIPPNEVAQAVRGAVLVSTEWFYSNRGPGEEWLYNSRGP